MAGRGFRPRRSGASALRAGPPMTTTGSGDIVMRRETDANVLAVIRDVGGGDSVIAEICGSTIS